MFPLGTPFKEQQTQFEFVDDVMQTYMNNMQIIANEAVASGYFTEEEVEELIEEGKDIPFHTFAVWKAAGFVPKAGTHGWECRLWRKKNAKSNVDENDATEEERKREFYLTKSFLFHISQVQMLEKVE